MQEYVAGFMFDYGGKEVVLVKKSRPEWQRGLLNGVGGKIEEWETPADAMHREFCEETGYAVGGWQRFCTLSGRDFKVYFYFLHDDPEALYATTQSTHDETIEVHFVAKVLADDWYKCIPHVRWLIPMALEQGRETAQGQSVGYDVTEVRQV